MEEEDPLRQPWWAEVRSGESNGTEAKSRKSISGGGDWSRVQWVFNCQVYKGGFDKDEGVETRA